MEQIPINLTSKLSYIKLNPFAGKKKFISYTSIPPIFESCKNRSKYTATVNKTTIVSSLKNVYKKKRVQEGNPKEQ